MQGLVLLASMTWLLTGASRKGNGMPAFILLVLGTIQMGLHAFGLFGEPAWIQRAVAVACAVLAILGLALYAGLHLTETGIRGRS